MASIDSLPQEQSAVLNLVIKRECTFAEIAQLLDIDRDAVRERALNGLDGLGPTTTVPRRERALISDYLLGQLSPREAEQAREGLARDPQQRAWARVVAAEIGPVSAKPLPEIPAAAAKQASGAKSPAQPPSADQPAPAKEAREPEPERPAEAPAFPDQSDEPADAPAEQPAKPASSMPASSRRGGAILLGLLAVVIIALVVVLVTSGSGKTTKTAKRSTGTTAASTTAAQNSPQAGCKQVKPITGAQCLAAVPVISPTGKKQPSGAAEVLKVKANKKDELLVVGAGLPPNTNNAYGAWLYNSSSQRSEFLGFYSRKVTKDGRMYILGPLPSNAGSYDQLLVTSEHTEKPTKPGQIVLEASFADS